MIRLARLSTAIVLLSMLLGCVVYDDRPYPDSSYSGYAGDDYAPQSYYSYPSSNLHFYEGRSRYDGDHDGYRGDRDHGHKDHRGDRGDAGGQHGNESRD